MQACRSATFRSWSTDAVKESKDTELTSDIEQQQQHYQQLQGIQAGSKGPLLKVMHVMATARKVVYREPLSIPTQYPASTSTVAQSRL